MPSHATAVLTGHLAKAPEMRTTNGGKNYCKFAIGVNTGFGDRAVTTWWNITVFARCAGKR